MSTDKVVIEVSAEEAAKIEAMRARIAQEERQLKAQADRDAYKQLVDEAVAESFAELESLSEQLAAARARVYERFEGLIQEKIKLYGVDTSQNSHTFRNEDSAQRITIGRYKRDAWLDTAEEGVELIKKYLESLAKDEDSQALVSMVLSLLARDKANRLDSDKVMQLQKYAMERKDAKLLEGLEIITRAHIPEHTKLFVKAEQKNEVGKWVGLPLSITEP